MVLYGFVCVLMLCLLKDGNCSHESISSLFPVLYSKLALWLSGLHFLPSNTFHSGLFLSVLISEASQMHEAVLF